MDIDKCALTGLRFKDGELSPLSDMTIEYNNDIVGNVKITIPAYNDLTQNNFSDFNPERFLIAGICKNRTINGEPPILIDSNFIRYNYKSLNPPIDFEEKCIVFLKYIYQNGGRENKEFEFHGPRHFSIAYSVPEEFCRIIDYLNDNHFITIRNGMVIARTPGSKMFSGVKITNIGKDEVKKLLPQIPLIGLVNQNIETGDSDIDNKINHAKDLFFSQPVNMDKMRSACETLIFVLEPLRESLKSYFKAKDVSDFFQIVNSFDVRHNNNHTKDLIYEEQLEWIFYSLLNTINTYVKLKNRLK